MAYRLKKLSKLKEDKYKEITLRHIILKVLKSENKQKSQRSSEKEMTPYIKGKYTE